MRTTHHQHLELGDDASLYAFKNRGFLTWNQGIQMWTIDRPISSCTHATTFCRKNCYTLKAYRQYHHIMAASDLKNAYRWEKMTGPLLRSEIESKNENARVRRAKRVRFCSKGEPFSKLEDVNKIQDIALHNPDVLFWVPTRAWRHPAFRDRIEADLLHFPNLRIMASIDPSNISEEVQEITENGWSTMFFGIDDIEEAEGIYKIKFAKCPKTHDGQHGSCQTCGHCFGIKQINVHLKKH